MGADWTPEVMAKVMRTKEACKELANISTNPQVKDLGKFDLDQFELYEDLFCNLLAQSYGVIGEPLLYVIWDDVASSVFENEEEECMYQLLLDSGSYEMDNHAMYHKLKSFSIDTLGWAWIEQFHQWAISCDPTWNDIPGKVPVA